MKTLVLYREKSEQATPVAAFIRDFERQTGMKVKKVELDSLEGSKLAELYAIDVYPAVLVTREDSELQNLWQGMQLPPVSEVEHAARA